MPTPPKRQKWWGYKLVSLPYHPISQAVVSHNRKTKPKSQPTKNTTNEMQVTGKTAKMLEDAMLYTVFYGNP